MTGRERVAVALERREPDRVPYCELHVDQQIAARLVGDALSGEANPSIETQARTVAEEKELARVMGKDNITFVLRSTVFAHHGTGEDGRQFYGAGMITSEKDLDKHRLPDPTLPSFYDAARRFVDEKGDFSAWLVTRLGVFPTMLSMGMEAFGLALYDNPRFVERVRDMYFEWEEAMLERAGAIGFDVVASTDDLAGKTGPLFSPQMFREMFLPGMRRCAERITVPWVIHTDGHIMPILEDLLSLGICGLHPIEKGAMDIRAMKRDYGDRLCLLGNVDLNILGLGTPADTDAEVRDLVRDVAPGGGYIVTSGNSVASYLEPANVLAMSRAVATYGTYPIAV